MFLKVKGFPLGGHKGSLWGCASPQGTQGGSTAVEPEHYPWWPAHCLLWAWGRPTYPSCEDCWGTAAVKNHPSWRPLWGARYQLLSLDNGQSPPLRTHMALGTGMSADNCRPLLSSGIALPACCQRKPVRHLGGKGRHVSRGKVKCPWKGDTRWWPISANTRQCLDFGCTFCRFHSLQICLELLQFPPWQSSASSTLQGPGGACAPFPATWHQGTVCFATDNHAAPQPSPC